MPGPKFQSFKEMMAQVRAPWSIQLDCTAVKKGLDNHRIDIELDRQFVMCARRVMEEAVKREVGGKRLSTPVDGMDALRRTYEDMMKGSLHRTKTDLRADQVRVLQFGVAKFLVQEVRSHLDGIIKQLDDSVAHQKFAGSRGQLATQERLSWIRKNYGAFHFRALRNVQKQLQKEEVNRLRPLREQLLGEESADLTHVLLNPMLAAVNPLSPHLLLESYAMWPYNADGIIKANAAVEALLARRMRPFKIFPLKPKMKKRGQKPPAEIHDEFGGLFALQPLLGPSPDQKDRVREEFCWLDHPGHIRLLFDPRTHEQNLDDIKGIFGRSIYKSNCKSLEKVGRQARNKFTDGPQFKEMIAGYLMRDAWRQSMENLIELPMACAYVADNDAKAILARIDRNKEGATDLIRRMDEWAKQVNQLYKEESDEYAMRVLSDLSRFRLHLKYYRLAHRMFNRVNVITDARQVELSQASGHLYQLSGPREGQGAVHAAEAEAVHHTILKVEVRGSETITQELVKQKLNPESHFSARLYGPINESLRTYAAEKISADGDAVILGINEYNVEPEQWYSVSRACGLAKDIVEAVTAKDINARQKGITDIEIGIGICYRDEGPRLLSDGNGTITMSPAAVSAGRLASCSDKLRRIFDSGTFNVEVVQLAQSGDKGQEYLRYNVNGILLDKAAFRKLSTEVNLKKLKVKVDRGMGTLYVGRFPDISGKERDIVIREGAVGSWQREKFRKGREGGPVFYEVLPHSSKLASQAVEAARAQAARAV